MDVTTAINRLQRAGADSSRATKKLHEAADQAALMVIEALPRELVSAFDPDHGVQDSILPRGYYVQRVRSNVGSALYLMSRSDEWIGGQGTLGGYLHGDFHASTGEQTREGSLRFAKDVAEGWLDELSAFLEAAAAKETAAAEVLENAENVEAGS